MKLVVCDDLKEDADFSLNIINDYLKNIQDDYNICYKTPDELDSEIQNGNFEYDIAVLDIDYKGYNFNGIDLGQKINNSCPLCSIIYLTAILDFASDVYETEHCYFVMKKNQKLTMNRALDKAVKRMQLEMKALGRKLTEEEKNEIIFGFLRESNESNQ